jgi:NDP-sugar pyrophosphorylase family protein
MKAVILVGGLGTRLKPFTEVIPKPLLPIGEKAILEIQIEHLKEHGFDEIYLATNYKSEYIENFFGDGSKYGVKLTISKENEPLGTVGPLSLLKNELSNEPFLVMNGDILTKCDFFKLYQFGKKINADLTVCIKEFVTPFRFGNIFFNEDFVTAIEEKPNFKTNILAGIYIMKPSVFEYISYNEPLSMDKLINTMLAENSPIAKYMIHEYWLDIGVVDDYKEVQEVYNNHFKDN